jgi:hypothetical protein
MGNLPSKANIKTVKNERELLCRKRLTTMLEEQWLNGSALIELVIALPMCLRTSRIRAFCMYVPSGFGGSRENLAGELL